MPKSFSELVREVLFTDERRRHYWEDGELFEPNPGKQFDIYRAWPSSFGDTGKFGCTAVFVAGAKRIGHPMGTWRWQVDGTDPKDWPYFQEGTGMESVPFEEAVEEASRAFQDCAAEGQNADANDWADYHGDPEDDGGW